MKIFKFGGASVKNGASVRNVANIINNHSDQNLVVVVSAMDKTTNALETLTEAYFNRDTDKAIQLFEQIKSFHFNIADELFENRKHLAFSTLEQIFYHLYYYLLIETPGKNYNFEYDRIVSTGEIVSTHILSHYLSDLNIAHRWFKASDLIITDSNYREAEVDWLKTENAVKSRILGYFGKNKGKVVALTQGFLGGTTQGFITTLGREGSDYTAAILGYTLQADEVVIWKDVPGLLNADPKKFEETIWLPNISYQEAIELAYYGASVIHPKTLKPLLKRNIPLKIKSFENPEMVGSVINQINKFDNKHPSYILKTNQILLSIFSKDFSFIAEQKLSKIFSEFARTATRINLMQNSALSFSVCFDYDKFKTPEILRNLEKLFTIKYNTNVDLITIRHFDKAKLDNILKGRELLLEQKSRTTLQWIVK